LRPFDPGAFKSNARPLNCRYTSKWTEWHTGIVEDEVGHSGGILVCLIFCNGTQVKGSLTRRPCRRNPTALWETRLRRERSALAEARLRSPTRAVAVGHLSAIRRLRVGPGCRPRLAGGHRPARPAAAPDSRRRHHPLLLKGTMSGLDLSYK